MSIKIIDSTEKMMKGFLGELLPQINSKLISGKASIQSAIKTVVQDRLKDTDTYRELSTNSKLTNLFGFPAGTETNRAYSIVQEIMNGVRIVIEPYHVKSAATIAGKVLVEVNWGGVFKNQDGVVITEKGAKIDWIRWLLIHGSTWEISSEYATLFAASKTFSKSRAEHSLQILSKHPKLVRFVPAEFAGVETDNWITRTLGADYSDEIGNIIFSYIS